MTDVLLPSPFSAAACSSDETVRIAVAGEIDMATAPQLKAVLLAGIEQPTPPRALKVDLAEVTFMDASGIGVLLTVRETARRRGVDFTVQNPRGIVLRIFEILGLTETLLLAPVPG